MASLLQNSAPSFRTMKGFVLIRREKKFSRGLRGGGDDDAEPESFLQRPKTRPIRTIMPAGLRRPPEKIERTPWPG